jgi:glucose dehydrogenase
VVKKVYAFCRSRLNQMKRRVLIVSGLLLLWLRPARPQEWPVYGNDPGGSRYSPLTQIDRTNVARLRAAWVYHTKDFADEGKYPMFTAFECTPLVVDGVMYVTTARSRLIALEAETGRELWVFDPKVSAGRPGSQLVNRGSAYWSDGASKRIFLGTADGRLFAIDAANGKPAAQFGDNGWIDLRRGVADSFPAAGWGLSSQAVVWRDLVITGARSPDGEPQGPSGDVRAFSARTGKPVWRFHVVPRQGEFGVETWEDESWKERAGVNPWSMMSVDVERGMVFVPLTSPATDFYGGDRKGANLFGDCVLALDAATGKRIWHFQTIHHDLWDWDLPAMPNLVTLHRGGKDIPAVAQVTKTGFLFVLDRLTGKPLFDVEERPVPQSTVPGEQTWPTQPFPVKPPPYARQTMTWDELTDVTPESRAECRKLIDGAATGPMFRPIGLAYTVMFPGTNGGANWGGASYDPVSNLLFVNSMDVGALYKLAPRPEGSKIPYRPMGRGTQSSRFWDHNLYPCQKPPWGFLTAIDLDKGEFRWRVTLGVVDELIARGIPPTGAPNLGGSIATAGGLVFIGATNDSRFRAFDKDTGKELWVTRLPASAHATPMTFMGKKTGKQFVVIAAGGGNKYNSTYSDSLVAYSLP